MAQVLHQCAATAHAVRSESQRSTEAVATLRHRYSIHPTPYASGAIMTPSKYPEGPKVHRSISLAPMEKATAATFRQKTLLPLDDYLYALQREDSSLTRSSLHRFYRQHGISQLPKENESTLERNESPRVFPDPRRPLEVSLLKLNG